MITETEARKKWCPLVRVGNEAGCNRSHNDFGATAHCIGSACMAWREGIWDHQRNLKPEDRTPGVGYCGAFGAVGSPPESSK